MKNSGIKINPLSNTDDDGPLQKEVGQLSLDIFYLENDLIIVAPIAGVERKDLSISITDDTLVIKGERKLLPNIPEDNYYTRECFWGPFSRAIVLPLEAEIEKANATFDLNILEIKIPVREKEKTKIIKIAS